MQSSNRSSRLPQESGAPVRRLACLGDSNTYGYDPRSPLGSRYPQDIRWTALLDRMPGWSVRNLGENGREIPCTPAQLRVVDDLFSPCAPPDALMVMLGSNDLLQHPGFTAEDTAQRMECLLRHLQSNPALAKTRLLLAAPPPMQPGVWVAEERLLLQSARLGGCYAGLARRLAIGFADAGSCQVSLSFDGVHFSPEGHRAFAAWLADRLDQLIPPCEPEHFLIQEEVQRSPALVRQLTQVWRASVQATHTFLSAASLEELSQYVPQALSEVAHLVVAYQGGEPVGFLGAQGEWLEMLFLSPHVFGLGLGRRLVDLALENYGLLSVCVNEQNSHAAGFYRHMGFQVYRRSGQDQQGRPYPLLYLRLAPDRQYHPAASPF